MFLAEYKQCLSAWLWVSVTKASMNPYLLISGDVHDRKLTSEAGERDVKEASSNFKNIKSLTILTCVNVTEC
jgi:hypothetical protein